MNTLNAQIVSQQAVNIQWDHAVNIVQQTRDVGKASPMLQNNASMLPKTRRIEHDAASILLVQRARMKRRVPVSSACGFQAQTTAGMGALGLDAG